MYTSKNLDIDFKYLLHSLDFIQEYSLIKQKYQNLVVSVCKSATHTRLRFTLLGQQLSTAREL